MKQTRSISLLSLLGLALAVLSGCTTTTQAPVVDRTPVAATKPAAPAEEPKLERGMYIVKKGDTLIRIALDHGLNYRDLAAWNNLANPDDIKLGQLLRVMPPEGVVTSPVSIPVPEVRTAPVPKKTSPRGDKRPYSDTAMADMQKGERGERNDSDKSDSPRQAPARSDRTADSTPAPAPAAAPTGIVPGATVTATDDEKLSWMWPSDGKIIATFDEGKNKGIDIAGRAGQHVMASAAGKVMYAGSGIRGYGNLVIVKHSNSLLSAYAHNRTIVVKEGQTVSKGQVIAEMGDSDADSVKLHFEIRQQGKPVDPSRFLPSR
ncbi:MAG: peptidoglycan DD-metalloendopeptidase family protein [Gammaproteobacteria bacterium]